MSFNFYFPESAWNCYYALEINQIISQDPRIRLSLWHLRRFLDLFRKVLIFVDGFRDGPHAGRLIRYVSWRSFLSGIQDSSTVVKLFTHLYQADGHFGFFLCPEVEVCPPESRLELARFFLTHAYRERVTIDGRRVADVEVLNGSIWRHPCLMTVRSKSPALLQLLLQYGALMDLQDGQISLARTVVFNLLAITCAILEVENELRRMEARIQGRPPVDPDQDQAFLDARQNLQDIAGLLMRTSTQNQACYLPLMEFPGFGEQELACPMTLKHVCRLVVRKVLHDNWQLPEGVDALPIPNSVKRYINLES